MKKLLKLFFVLCVISFVFALTPLFAQIATDSFTHIGSATPSVLSNEMPLQQVRSLSANYFHDGLDGSCLGTPAFSGYTTGFIGQSAHFAGGQNNIGYSSGGQIKSSGFISFYYYSNGYYPAYNNCNFIFTQAGFGGASYGSLQLWINSNNQLVYSQIGSGFWNYMTTGAIPLNTWIKITAVYGSYGMYLYINDQLAVSDPSRRDPIASRIFYIGSKSFWGPETSFAGNVDEILSGIPAVKIITPNDGSTFNSDETITLSGLGNNLIWSENGIQLAVGNDVEVSLTSGEHIITLSGTDFVGRPGNDSVTITVTGAEVTSVAATPSTLWIDASGASSGIVFRAETSDDTDVKFKVITPTGTEIPIGSKATQNKVAKLSWWGNKDLLDGTYTIKASAGNSNKTATFTVKKVTADLTGLGKWMKETKDPSAVLPPSAKVEVCPLVPWEEMLSLPEGFFADLNVEDPVNIVSGDYILPEVDLKLNSRHSLVMARIYNSLDHETGAFGLGWSSPYTSHLKIASDYVIFVNSDGSRVLFNKQNNDYIPTTVTELKLTHDAALDTWSLSKPQGSVWKFRGDGKITSISKSCCGTGATDKVRFTYVNNNLDKVAAPSGQYLQFTYNSDNLITNVTDSTGRTLSYAYDQNKQLVSFTNPLGQVTSYVYNDDHFLTNITKPGNRITAITYADRRVSSVTSPNGDTSHFSWDYNARKMSLVGLDNETHEYGFDEDWIINSYSVPSANLTKNYTFVNTGITGLTDSLGNSESFAYNSDNLLVSSSDKLGNVTTYEWEPNLHKLTRKTDALGRVWSYEWCTRGNLISKTDPAGNKTTYTYDTHDNRTSITNALGQVTRYVYDSTGNYLLQTIDAMGNISSYTYDARGNMLTSSDKLGRVTSYEYDLIDRLVKTTYPDGRWSQITYDEAGNVVSRKDNLNRITQYVYDLTGKLLSVTYPDNTTSSYAYDASGRKTSSTDQLGRVTQYEYNALGKMIKTIMPDSSYQTFNYDTEGRLVSKTDELGNTTSFEYDPMGRLLATVDPAGSRWESQYDIVGRKIASKDPLNRITAYEYDVLDRNIKTISPDLTFSTSNYDALGNMLVSTNALNQQTTYEYDSLNRQVKTTLANGAQFTTTYDASGQVISETNALGNSTLYAYDLAGRRVSVTDALGNISQFFYDSAGRLIKTIDAMGGIATMTYNIMDRTIAQSDVLGRINSYEYDSAGRRIAKTDALGRRTIFAYDNRDRLTTEVDGEGHRISYTYNVLGQKLSFTDGAGRTWRWVYDVLGRVVATIDPMGNEDTKVYDAVGNMISKTNARGQTTSNEFDVMNRLIKITYPDATIATFSYDILGRGTYRSGTAGAVEKTYDIAGNLAKENFVNLNKSWSYTYDLMGNKIQAVSPENVTYKYSYDKLSRLIELNTGRRDEKVNYSYDAIGRTIESKRYGVTTANLFDAAGQLLETKHYKLVLYRHSHGCGKYKHHNKKTPTYKEKIIALRQYSYDLAGNRISMTDEDGNVTSYQYDRSNWLVQVTYPNNNVVTYTYNNAGDRIREQVNDDPAITYSYDAAGRMVSKADKVYSYDADGNMITDDIATYTWNSDNRLIKVEKSMVGCKHDKDRKGHAYGHNKHGKSGVAYEEYTYLPEDWRRITRKIGTIKTTGNHTRNEAETFVSVYDGADESNEYELKKNKYSCRNKKHNKKPNKLKLVKSYISGPNTDDMEFTRSKNKSFAMLKDGLDSTIVLSDKEGRSIARIGYDAWGNFRWSKKAKESCGTNNYDEYLDRFCNTRGFGHKNHNSWSFGKTYAKKLTPYLYTGRRFNRFTTQYFHRNRYYQPKYGRFTTKDPIGFRGDVNLYRYANSNPVLFTDPLGLRKATPFERLFWTSFHKSSLAKKLINNYLDDTGKEIKLTKEEMIQTATFASLKKSRDFRIWKRSLATYSGDFDFSGNGLGGAGTHGTLAHFTIKWDGQAHIGAGGECWSFNGTMSFKDTFDFDPLYLKTHRSLPAEILVIVASLGMPGQAFPVTSANVSVSQDSTQNEAEWAGSPARNHVTGDYFVDFLNYYGFNFSGMK